MSLINPNGPFIAGDDIICYKVVVQKKNSNRFVSPIYKLFDWKIGDVVSIKQFDQTLEQKHYTVLSNKKDFKSTCKVTTVGLYSFINKGDALLYFNNNRKDYEYHIFKAIIPKDSEYYIGNSTLKIFKHHPNCYLSNQLQLIEEVSHDWHRLLFR